MVNRYVFLASWLLFVGFLGGPVLAAFTIEAIDLGKGFLSPGSKLGYEGTSEGDAIAVDLYLYNPDSKFSFLVQADVAPEPNSTFNGHFRIPNNTPPALNYVLAIFQDLAQPYLASSLPFDIGPLPSNTPPPPSTPPPTSTVYTTLSSPTPPYSHPLPRPSPTSVDGPQPTPLPTTRSSSHLSSPTTTPIAFPSSFSSPNHSSASPGTTQASDVTNGPAPTSPGRPPLDAGQDTEPRIDSAQVNISAIVGGTVGTVVAASLVLWIFLCWRKYKRKSKGIPQPFPFLIIPPLRILPSPSEASQQRSPISNHSNCISTIPDPYHDIRLREPEKQAELLRQERQRIDTQLAKLEGSGYGVSTSRSAGKTFSRTDFSPSSSASISSPSSTAPTSTPPDLLEELNAMRQKIRQLEAERHANPPSFDDNPSQSLNLGGHLPPADSAPNSKAALRSNSHSLFSSPPEYDTTSPLHNSSHHSSASKTQCFCRDCG